MGLETRVQRSAYGDGECFDIFGNKDRVSVIKFD